MDFEEWMIEVDRILISKIGLTSSDLRDRLWRDSYDNGDEPQEAIRELCGDPDNMEAFMQEELWG